jgi:AcrR family transcriptional regulator
MKDMTPRQKEIIEVAIKLIAQGGIQKLTMSNIAKQIGFSEPAIYRHFQSKMDVLLAILGQFKQRSEFQLKRAQFFDSSGLILLEAIFLEHTKQFVDHPQMAAVMFSEEVFQNDVRLAEEIFSIMTLIHDTIVDIIKRAQARKELRADLPKEHLSLMFLGTLRLLVKRWYLSNYGFDLQQESVKVWESWKTLLAVQS